MPAASKLLLPLAGLALLAAPPAMAQETRMTGIKLTGNLPISIESDKLDVQDAEHQATFTGNVTVTQGDMFMKAGSMVVHYASGAMSAAGGGMSQTGASGIERIEVADKVYVKSKTQVATGDTGSFDMQSEVLVLAGKEVVLTDAGNVIKGCKLTVQMKTGQARFTECRVQVLLKPNSGGAQQ